MFPPHCERLQLLFGQERKLGIRNGRLKIWKCGTREQRGLIGCGKNTRTRSLETGMNRINFDTMFDDSNFGRSLRFERCSKADKTSRHRCIVFPQGRSNLPNRASTSPARRIPCSLDRERRGTGGRNRAPTLCSPSNAASKTIVRRHPQLDVSSRRRLTERTGAHPNRQELLISFLFFFQAI